MRLLRYIVAVLGFVSLIAIALFLKLCFDIDRQGRMDQAQPADVIVVLGARVLPNGQAGPDLEARTAHAISLYQAGLAPRIICTGGVRGERSSAAAVARNLASLRGVPQEAIYLADGSWKTQEDAAQTAAVMAQHGWQTAIVVSHPLHVYRAKLFFEREGIVAYTSPTTTDVDGIAQPWRAYYAVREGAGVLWPYLEQMGFPSYWTAHLQRLVYEHR
ncbi:MAG: YdcF family protein [Anaerolineae bacterium]|nr:YdcF family protein [Anaerolineae bacterium]